MKWDELADTPAAAAGQGPTPVSDPTPADLDMSEPGDPDEDFDPDDPGEDFDDAGYDSDPTPAPAVPEASASTLAHVGHLVGVPVHAASDDPRTLPIAAALGELLLLGDPHDTGPWRPAVAYPASVASVFFRTYASILADQPPGAPVSQAADAAGVSGDLLEVLADVCDQVVEATEPVTFAAWTAAQWVEFDTRARANVAGNRFSTPPRDPADPDGWATAAGDLEAWVTCALGELVVVELCYLLTLLPQFSRDSTRQLLAQVSGLVSAFPLVAAVTTRPSGFGAVRAAAAGGLTNLR